MCYSILAHGITKSLLVTIIIDIRDVKIGLFRLSFPLELLLSNNPFIGHLELGLHIVHVCGNPLHEFLDLFNRTYEGIDIADTMCWGTRF